MLIDAPPGAPTGSAFDVETAAGTPELLGSTPLARQLGADISAAAVHAGGVLLVAEPGSDVEGLAAQIHGQGRTAGHPLVSVAGDLGDPDALIEMLFGRACGSSPSDLELVDSASVLGRAAGGTVLLRDADQLPASVQARLARVARDGELRTRAGEAPSRIRLMASCAPAADVAAERRRFAPDLYRRLSATRILVPPLRRRREDIPVIARHLIDVIGFSEARPPVAFTETALVLLSALDWQDNLRELRSLIVRLLTSHAREHTIRLDDVLAAVPLGAGPVALPPGSLRDARLRFEREYIAGVLQHHGWRMSEAARTLGIQRPNLYRKTRQLGIALLKPVDPAGSR